MKFYLTMPQGLKPHYRNELAAYSDEFSSGNLPQAWRHLERAHIIGQPWALEHTAIHWEMLKFGFRIKDGREVVGQLPRLIFGGVKSFVGKIPVGNTGGANVPPLKSMEVPPDLQYILRPYLQK